MTVKLMNEEHWLSNAGRKYSEVLRNNVFQCHFVHYKAHMNWPRMEPGSQQ